MGILLLKVIDEMLEIHVFSDFAKNELFLADFHTGKDGAYEEKRLQRQQM